MVQIVARNIIEDEQQLTKRTIKTHSFFVPARSYCYAKINYLGDDMKLEDIKTGDYLYYTERPHSNYADSLIHIRNVDGVDMAHPICTNYNDEYINDTGRNDWSNDLPVAAYFDENCWFKTGYKEEYGDPAAWMSVNFPLSAYTLS